MKLQQRVSQLERRQPSTEPPGAVLNRMMGKLDGLAHRLQSAPGGMAPATVGTLPADELDRVRAALAVDVEFMRLHRKGKGAR